MCAVYTLDYCTGWPFLSEPLIKGRFALFIRARRKKYGDDSKEEYRELQTRRGFRKHFYFLAGTKHAFTPMDALSVSVKSTPLSTGHHLVNCARPSSTLSLRKTPTCSDKAPGEPPGQGEDLKMCLMRNDDSGEVKTEY